MRIKRLKYEDERFWDIWTLLFAFILVIPDGIGSISAWTQYLLYKWGLYAAYVGILFLFVLRIIQLGTVTKTFLSFAVFMAATLFILFLKGHGLWAWFSSFSVCLFVVLLAEANRERLDKLILSFLIILEFWIYVNFLLMILIPGGMYYAEANNSYLNWVLGYKSSLQYYILPALCFSWLNMKYRSQRARYLVLLTVSWVTTLIAKNAMLLVGLAVFTVLQFSRLWNIKKLFNIWTYYIVDIAANVVIVFLLPWFTNTQLGTKLLVSLGKTAALSSRASIIWPMTLDYIKDHLFFGNGMYTSQSRILLYGEMSGFIHSHNQLMEIMFIGGAFLMCFYVILHIRIGKSLTANLITDASKIISISIFILYLMMTVEVFTRLVSAPVWLILFLGGNCRFVHDSFMLRRDCTYKEKVFIVRFNR